MKLFILSVFLLNGCATHEMTHIVTSGIVQRTAALSDCPCLPPLVLPPVVGNLNYTEAPLLSGLSYTANGDSVILNIPPVANAADFRVYALVDGIKIYLNNGGEQVDGAEIYCSGQYQSNSPRTLPIVLQHVQVDGLSGSAKLVVEAIDRQCPFPGVMGAVRSDQVVYEGDDPTEIVPFSVWTDAEIKARYGSVIHNGQRPGDKLGAPASNIPPTVLARGFIDVNLSRVITGLNNLNVLIDGYGGVINRVKSLSDDAGRSQQGAMYSDDKLIYYSYGNQHTQLFKRDNVLHSVIADWHQDIFGQVYWTPKNTVNIDNGYLHSSWETASDSSGRRYWWWFLCGADGNNQTLNVDGTLKSPIVQTPFFMEADGRNPSLALWNCLQVFPRDGSPIPIGSDNRNPQTDIRIQINPVGRERGPVNISPKQFAATWISPSWYRQQDSSGKLGGPILDDKLVNAPRQRYDIYVSRSRVVLYIDGEQRLCNDYPSIPLTMAEGALGLGQVLYHTAAERNDFNRSFYHEENQINWLYNTPYVDEHTWDNVGYKEASALPTDFDVTKCYRYVPAQ